MESYHSYQSTPHNIVNDMGPTTSPGSNSTLIAELQRNEGHTVTICTYAILIPISALGNITVLLAMWRRRKKSRTRINTMLMHLAIADLLVTFLMMPLDLFWAYTVEWVAGDTLCRVGAFFRIFGLYLSSFVIICISVDRYLAVLKPMNLYQVDQRGKIMLTTAWLGSVILSAPQIIIFHVESHPQNPAFKQCVSFGAFPSRYQELAYLYCGMFVMYLLPLAVIVFCYTSIVIEIFKRSTETNLDSFRRSGLGFLGRARSRTLKMTIIIVVVFIICWTPYYVMCVWFWIDQISAKQIDHKIQRFLFLFASTNSCMNPIVYGIFNIRTRRAGGHLERGRAYSGRMSYATDMRLPMNFSLRSVE